MEAGSDWKGGNYKALPVQTMRAVSDIHQFALTTPARRVAETPAGTMDKFLGDTEAETLKGFDADDWLRQLEAMIAQDTSKAFGGSLEATAKSVHAKVLVIAAAQDHMVNPTSALEFARFANAETLVLESDCGHLSPGCEGAKVSAAIGKFLQ
jgi:homoserine O-acetyltransferase